MKVWLGILLLAVAANASEKDLLSVSAGQKHTCGVTSDGFIECFGNNDNKQCNNYEPRRATNGKFVQVSAGYRHTCGVTSQGFIECFGADDKGQSNKFQPKKATHGKFVQVSAGDLQTCGVTSEGSIECFGAKQEIFQATEATNLGNDPLRRARTQQQMQAKQVSKVGFVQVSTGDEHACGVTSDGVIKCIGENMWGRTNGGHPKRASDGKFVNVSVGDYHTCGLTDRGSIECFGGNEDQNTNDNKPKKPSDGKFVQLSVGTQHTCGVTDKGSIECFGGKKERRKKYEYDTPKHASEGKFLQVSAGAFHTCGLTSKGSIQCFGSDKDGQINEHQPYILNNRAHKGTFLKSGKYHNCEKGSFNDLMGQRSCKLCAIGTFNDQEGQSNVDSCKQCGTGKFNSKRGQAKCLECPVGTIVTGDHSRCIDEGISKSVKNLQLALANQKEKMDDVSNKNSRLWQIETIRSNYDAIMQERKAKDNKDEKDACEAESQAGTIVFPAIEIENEIEKNEDTTCIDTNREELLKSFCSFTSDLDKLFKIQGISKKAKTFWPNLCCKERKDKTLKVCEDPTNTIKRENIVPFALSQGGDYSQHTLYSEVKESIKEEGYLHAGMKKLIDSLPAVSGSKKVELTKLTNSFFHDVSLCGPRIVDAPDAKDRKKLCQLFIPYQHSMAQFYRLIESLFTQPLPTQSSMLETMESSFRKRQSRVEKAKRPTMQTLMMSKPALASGSNDKACKVTPGNGMLITHELKEKKRVYCKGYNHLDLSNANVKNIAVHYLENDIVPRHLEKDKWMNALNSILRYQVTDTSCPFRPLFHPKDISIQQVAMNVPGSQNRWAAVVNLNTKDEDGYLQSELPECERKDYLIGAKVKVTAFIDEKNCCEGEPNYEKCMKLQEFTRCANGKPKCFEPEKQLKCAGKLKPLVMKEGKHTKMIELIGTKYFVTSGNRRRRLLQSGQSSC